MKNDAKQKQVNPEIEEKMRLIANLIIDRIIEDQKNGVLKLKPIKKRVIQKGNTP